MPCTGQIEKCLIATRGLEDGALHNDILADRHQRWQAADGVSGRIDNRTPRARITLELSAELAAPQEQAHHLICSHSCFVRVPYEVD